MWLEAQPQVYVLAVSGQESIWLGWQQRRVKTLLAALPDDSWTRLSAGDGVKGPRWYHWRWLSLTEPLDPWLAPLAVDAAPCERPQRGDGLCRICTPGDFAGGVGAGRGQPLDDGEPR
jgi:hypothetical protein